MNKAYLDTNGSLLNNKLLAVKFRICLKYCQRINNNLVYYSPVVLISLVIYYPFANPNDHRYLSCVINCVHNIKVMNIMSLPILPPLPLYYILRNS